jgi:hypothetical protein
MRVSTRGAGLLILGGVRTPKGRDSAGVVPRSALLADSRIPYYGSVARVKQIKSSVQRVLRIPNRRLPARSRF